MTPVLIVWIIAGSLLGYGIHETVAEKPYQHSHINEDGSLEIHMDSKQAMKFCGGFGCYDPYLDIYIYSHNDHRMKAIVERHKKERNP
jgi:hypothetical protein